MQNYIRNLLPHASHQQQEARRAPNFFQELRIYPSYFCNREDIDKGDKILLPSSALNELYQLISSRNKNPMIFCLKNSHGGKLTYCGVLEFVAEEGNCYVPGWMFKMLKFMEPGNPGTVCLVPDLKKSKEHYYVKLQPHLTKFIDLPNPKAILEIQLRNFTCLHVGDTIRIKTFDGQYDIDIVEIKPKNQYEAICVIDTDVEVDFAPPHDYEEPTLNKKQSNITYQGEGPANTAKNNVFGGKGTRIDEKANTNPNRKPSQQVENVVEEYDPRKHRIVRGVRKNTYDWTGTATNVGDVTGVRKR